MKRTVVVLLAAVLILLPGIRGLSDAGGLLRFIPEGYTRDTDSSSDNTDDSDISGSSSDSPASPDTDTESSYGPWSSTDDSGDDSDFVPFSFDKPDYGPGEIIEDTSESNGTARGPGGSSYLSPGPPAPAKGYRIPAGLETVPSKVSRVSVPDSIPGTVGIVSFSETDDEVFIELDQAVPKLKILEVNGNTNVESTIFSKKNASSAKAHKTSRNSAAFKLRMIWNLDGLEYVREYCTRDGEMLFYRCTLTGNLDAEPYSPFTTAVRTLYFDENGNLVTEVYELRNKKDSFTRTAGYGTDGELTFTRQSWRSLEKYGYVLDIVRDGTGTLTALMLKNSKDDLYIRSEPADENLLSDNSVRATSRDISLFDDTLRIKYPCLASDIDAAEEDSLSSSGPATPTDLDSPAGPATPTDLASPAGPATPADLAPAGDPAGTADPDPETDPAEETGPGGETDPDDEADPGDETEPPEEESIAEISIPDGARLWCLSSDLYPYTTIYLFASEDPLLLMKGNKIILNAKAKDIEGNPPDTGSLLKSGTPAFDRLIID